MSGEARLAARELRPFGEAFAPPGVVLGYAVKLREIVGEDDCVWGSSPRARLEPFEERAGARLPSHEVEGGRSATRRLDGSTLTLPFPEIGDGICPAIVAEMTICVKPRVEVGGGFAEFAKPEVHIVQERIHARLSDVRIGPQIIFGVELGNRTERAKAIREIMQKRLVGLVGACVPARIEQRRRVEARGFADQRVMKQRVDVRLRDIRVLFKIPRRVEYDVRSESGLDALDEEMREGVGFRGQMGALSIERRVEIAHFEKAPRRRQVDRTQFFGA